METPVVVDWGTPPKLSISISITRPCGCTKEVKYDEKLGQYIAKYTRPSSLGKCTRHQARLIEEAP